MGMGGNAPTLEEYHGRRNYCRIKYATVEAEVPEFKGHVGGGPFEYRVCKTIYGIVFASPPAFRLGYVSGCGTEYATAEAEEMDAPTMEEEDPGCECPPTGRPLTSAPPPVGCWGSRRSRERQTVAGVALQYAAAEGEEAEVPSAGAAVTLDLDVPGSQRPLPVAPLPLPLPAFRRIRLQRDWVMIRRGMMERRIHNEGPGDRREKEGGRPDLSRFGGRLVFLNEAGRDACLPRSAAMHAEWPTRKLLQLGVDRGGGAQSAISLFDSFDKKWKLSQIQIRSRERGGLASDAAIGMTGSASTRTYINFAIIPTHPQSLSGKAPDGLYPCSLWDLALSLLTSLRSNIPPVSWYFIDTPPSQSKETSKSVFKTSLSVQSESKSERGKVGVRVLILLKVEAGGRGCIVLSGCLSLDSRPKKGQAGVVRGS
ncbi:hypothetical protein BDK51DRAFT_31946 [Blyttiomyces helicus]|uniref:Uncharacterized protein n=1 Tax=Blyttiomyces helicus TaxID=388810 RepID=A0A4P9W2U8_9FUNG|nr:hypothetical protein BDK51DRAFT_31946 [Blyttiomyces helicus]|eukprot:RKO86082.1 hypothetical protein BDK51DRAFT_31946 [Blyttiomyces helicus]